MKKYLSILVLVLCYAYTLAQTHIAYFDPFGFPRSSSYSIQMVKDVQGEIWFGCYSVNNDTFHIVDLSHTHSYAIPLNINTGGSYISEFTVDSRGDFLWFDSYGIGRMTQQGNIQHFYLPNEGGLVGFDTIYYNPIKIVDDRLGNDYFLSTRTHWDMQSQTSILDSVFLTKYDGLNFTKYSLTEAGILFTPSTYHSNTALLADYSGNIYVQLDSLKLIKFDGNNFSQIPIPSYFDFSGQYFIDRNNTLFYNDQSQHIYKMTPNVQMVYNHGAGNILCTNLADDNEGGVWLLGYEKLKYYNGVFQLVPEDNGAIDPNPVCNFCGYSIFDSDGNILTSASPECDIRAYSFAGFNTLSGHVFIDTNEDGAIGGGERGLEGAVVTQSPDFFIASTDSTGKYNLVYFDSLQTHTISYVPPIYYGLTTSPIYTISHDPSAQCCYNFGIAPLVAVQDLELDLTSSYAVPGFETAHWLTVKNTGTVVAGDSVTYEYDPLYTYLGSSPAADIVTGNKLIWTNVSLQPFEKKIFTVSFYLDSTISIGTILNATGMAYPIASDTTPNNNAHVLSEAVVGPFDPNMKVADKEVGLEAGDTIEYTIHFQNTGNFVATNVVLRDTLDENFDWSTLNVISSSHSMRYELKNNGIMAFYFNNIMLPDSHANEALSHGFVKYSIRTKASLSYGTPLHNTASIYFDFNLPIRTNTAVSWIGQPLGIKEGYEKDNHLSLYPNPTNDHLTIESDQIEGILYLYNAQGALQNSYNMNTNMKSIDVAHLAAGVYYVEVSKNGLTIRKKIVKL